MRYSCNRRGREEASASIWCQDGIAAETSTRCQLGKTCVCGSWVGPKRNRHILACCGLVQLKWPAAGILARLLPPTCTFRSITKHRENTQKCGSCPLRRTLYFLLSWFSQGFSHFLSIALAVCSAHATWCMAPAALHFASRSPNRAVFRVARVVKTLGFCMSWLGTDPDRRRQ
jgi:hypothetical protein